MVPVLDIEDGRSGLSNDLVVSSPDVKVHFMFTYACELQGPFVGNTSYPILLIGNTVDPTTPIIK